MAGIGKHIALSSLNSNHSSQPNSQANSQGQSNAQTNSLLTQGTVSAPLNAPPNAPHNAQLNAQLNAQMIHSMRGKGGKGKTGKKFAAKRFQQSGKDPFHINCPSLRRLCRKSGTKRISGYLYEELRTMIKDTMKDRIQDILTYTVHRRSKTVSPMDVFAAYKRRGKTIYY